MQSTSCAIMGWMKHNLESRLPGEIPITSDMQAGFRKGKGTKDQIANIYWIIEKAREFQKKKILLLH